MEMRYYLNIVFIHIILGDITFHFDWLNIATSKLSAILYHNYMKDGRFGCVRAELSAKPDGGLGRLTNQVLRFWLKVKELKNINMVNFLCLETMIMGNM